MKEKGEPDGGHEFRKLMIREWPQVWQCRKCKFLQRSESEPSPDMKPSCDEIRVMGVMEVELDELSHDE